MKKGIILISILIFTAVWGFAQTSFSRGEDLFMQNKPSEAAPFLESTVAENPYNVQAFLYLWRNFLFRLFWQRLF